MTPALDVVIVSFNTKDDLCACLASIYAAPPALPIAITVVDNASQDGSVAAVRAAWPDVRIVALDRNAGFAAANNIAIRAGSAPLVLLLNSDTIVPAGAIDALEGRRRDTSSVAAGPKLVDTAGRPEVSFGPMLSPAGEFAQMLRVRLAASHGRAARGYIERLVSRERSVDWVSGACLLVRRDAAVAAGLLDERYFMYEEDVDFCAALRAKGGRVLYTPHATVMHRRGRSVRAAGRGPSLHYDRSHVAFYDKHLPGWSGALKLWLKLRGRAPTLENTGARDR